MNVKELVIRGEDETYAYACGECGSMHRSWHNDAEESRAFAEKCCKPTPQKHCDCGKEIRPWMEACRKCALRKSLRAAEIVSQADYSGMVFDDFGSDEIAYFNSIDDMVESYGSSEPPAYCRPCRFVKMEASGEEFLEKIFNDAPTDDCGEPLFDEDNLVDVDEIAVAIDAWSAKQTAGWYEHDKSKVIILDQAAFDALIAPQPWEDGE